MGIEENLAARKPFLITRAFLAFVCAAYVLLAVWCAVLPSQTANSVGFTLRAGSGQSEYLVIYGGLQLALGLVFLWPLLHREFERRRPWSGSFCSAQSGGLSPVSSQEVL